MYTTCRLCIAGPKTESTRTPGCCLCAVDTQKHLRVHLAAIYIDGRIVSLRGQLNSSISFFNAPKNKGYNECNEKIPPLGDLSCMCLHEYIYIKHLCMFLMCL
jgi:hypothetical protein